MADEKVVAGWAVRAANGTMWLGPNTRATSPWDWQEKPRRRIFPTRDEAFKEFYGGMARDREAAVVRITRKVKPNQYYVVAGPYEKRNNAECLQNHCLAVASTAEYARWHVVEKDPSK